MLIDYAQYQCDGALAVQEVEYASPREIENMQAMLNMIEAANDAEAKFLQIELLRELGRFSEALQLLDPIVPDNDTSDVITAAQREFCAE